MTNYTQREFNEIIDRHREERQDALMVALMVAASAGVVAGIALVLLVQWAWR